MCSDLTLSDYYFGRDDVDGYIASDNEFSQSFPFIQLDEVQNIKKFDSLIQPIDRIMIDTSGVLKFALLNKSL